MKLNLECGNDIRNGYTNVSSVVMKVDELPENAVFVVGDPKNLDPIVEDGSVDEIVFNQPINIISPNQMVGILNHWYNKLNYSGILSIKFYDIRRVGRAAHSGELNLQDIHRVIFGSNNENKTVIDIDVVRNVAKSMNFSIESISQKQYIVTVELKKNAKN